MLETVRDTQQHQQAGHTKMTAVVLTANGLRVQFFVPLVHNQRGEAILPQRELNRMLDAMKVQRGQTYTVA